jgi:iron complex outermembrane receptor protein
VLFESTPPTFTDRNWRAYGSALTASAGRSDLVADLAAGNEQIYGRLNGTRAEAGDYEDGAGASVHSAYSRWSTNGTLGWRPDAATLVELTGARSDGHAAYADRAMDGAKFARDNLGLKAERTFDGAILKRLEAQAYYNYVDHVMDNYSLRTFVPSMMMPGRAASNPDRRTTGARIAADLKGPDGLTATVGLDYQDNRHRNRSTMNETTMPYENMARVKDAEFRNTGVFGEAILPFTADQRLVAGVRADRWRAEDARSAVTLGMMSSMPNPTAGARRSTTLVSGFGRYERDLAQAGTTLFAGIGYVERFPDYWELISTSRESATSLSAFLTRPERTTQFDFGAVHNAGNLQVSLSGFASRVDDYILIETNYVKGMRSTSITRNVDAQTFGTEADAAYALTPSLKLTGTVAYTYGKNLTDDRPLAQMPPLELRAGAEYGRGAWHGGLLARFVTAQKRVALDQGNVVGQDIGATGSFLVLSANAAWQPRKGLLVSAGIDNLFDRQYAEHLSRGGAMLSGYTQTTRVNEPGRTAWLKLSADLK